LLGSPSPFAESHAKDAPRQIPSKFRTSPAVLRLMPKKIASVGQSIGSVVTFFYHWNSDLDMAEDAKFSI
jgi:hypothetical protein